MEKLVRTFVIVVLSVAVGFVYITGCGGGSSSSRTINLGGVIMAPTVSGNIALPPNGSHPRPRLNHSGVNSSGDLVNALDSSAAADGNDKSLSIAKAAPAESAAQTTCHAYTVEGEDLGSFTSAADGAFSVAVSVDTLKGSDDTGTTWNEAVVVDCQNNIQLYYEVSINEDSLEDKDLGTANFVTTLAALTNARNVTSWHGWGSSYIDSLSAYDAACLADIMASLWDNSAISGEGLADDNGVIKEVVMAMLATGGSAATYSYASWPDLILAILSGSISEANWSAIAASVATTLGVSEATLTGYYGTLNGAFAAINNLLVAQFASGAYGATNICDNIKDDTLDTDAFIKPMLAADDTTTFADTYADSAGIMGYFGILEKCLTLGNCSELADKPGSYYGFLNGYAQDDTFANLWDGTNFSSEAVEGTLRAAASCGGSTWAAMEECGKGMYGTVYDGAGGWTSFESAGAFVDSLFDFWAGYYTGAIADGTFVDTALYYQTAWNSYSSSMDETSIVDCVMALYAAGNYDTSSCYETVSEDDGGGGGTSPYPTDIAGSYYYDDLSMDGGCDFPGTMIAASPMTFTASTGASFNAAITIGTYPLQFTCSYSSDTGISTCDYSSGGALFFSGDYIELYFWNSGSEKATMFIDGSLEGGLYYCSSATYPYQGKVYSTQ